IRQCPRTAVSAWLALRDLQVCLDSRRSQLPSHLREMSTEAPSPRKSQVAGQSFTIGSTPEVSTKYSSSSAQATSLATRVRPIADAVDSGVNCTSRVSK